MPLSEVTVRRGDIWAMLVIIALVVQSAWIFTDLTLETHYKWTTPPDEYCNVWEH